MKRFLLIGTLLISGKVLADLPYQVGRINEIEVSAPSTLKRSAYNAFSAWASTLPFGNGPTNFRIGIENPIATVNVRKVVGAQFIRNLAGDLVKCEVPAGEVLDRCAVSVTYDAANAAYDIAIFSVVSRVGGAPIQTPFANEILMQNFMIRTLGRIFGLSYDFSSSSNAMWAYASDGDWGLPNAVKFPSIEEANLLRARYPSVNGYQSWGSGSYNLAPIALMEIKNTTGTVVGGSYSFGVVGKTLPGSLRQLRWVVTSNVPTNGTYIPGQGLVNEVFSNLRVYQQGGAASCYVKTGNLLFRVTGKQSNLLQDYQGAIDAGAYMNEMLLESFAPYDYFTSSHPGNYTCGRSAGQAIDLWGQTYW